MHWGLVSVGKHGTIRTERMVCAASGNQIWSAEAGVLVIVHYAAGLRLTKFKFCMIVK